MQMQCYTLHLTAARRAEEGQKEGKKQQKEKKKEREKKRVVCYTMVLLRW